MIKIGDWVKCGCDFNGKCKNWARVSSIDGTNIILDNKIILPSHIAIKKSLKDIIKLYE